MTPFFTRRGDEGQTGILGKRRVPKDDLQIELLGDLDELSSSIGLARNASSVPLIKDILLQIQRHLFRIMSEVAAEEGQKDKFQFTTLEHIKWIEFQIETIEQKVEVPSYFILSGDSPSASFLDLARTVTRRAERRAVSLNGINRLFNRNLLIYLNRLSSLIFILEIFDLNQSGIKPASANEDIK